MSPVPARLNSKHSFNYFECGEPQLDRWAQAHAWADQQEGRSVTHVWTDSGGEYVLAYYTLLPTVTRVDDGVFARLRPRRYQGSEIAGVLIGKFALDRSLRGKSLGMDLLADAMLTASEAMQLIGGRHVLVDPMRGRPGLRKWYIEAGFNEIDGTDRLYVDLRS